jgi:hypothetical protein
MLMRRAHTERVRLTAMDERAHLVELGAFDRGTDALGARGVAGQEGR